MALPENAYSLSEFSTYRLIVLINSLFGSADTSVLFRYYTNADHRNYPIALFKEAVRRGVVFHDDIIATAARYQLGIFDE